MADDLESDLHWNAFLYVSGELDARAMMAFEEILLEDQAACEAVAQAVELVQRVGIVGLESGSILKIPKRSQRRRLIGVSFAVVAAAVLVASALITSWSPTSKVEGDESNVALAWSGLRRGIDADWSAVVAGPTPTEPGDPGLPTEHESAEASVERPLPSWLLSAASAPRVDPPQEEN